MVLSIRSQVEKFNARKTKMEMDSRAIGEAKFMESQQENSTGVDPSKLNKAGGIKEAAMVISYDGMEAFSNMFSNSIESALSNVITNRMEDITSTLESRLEKVFEDKILEAMSGLSEGIIKFSEGLGDRAEITLNSSVDSIIKSLHSQSKDPNLVNGYVEGEKGVEQTEISLNMTKDSGDDSEVKVFLSEIDEETRNKLIAKKIQEEKEMQEFVDHQKEPVSEIEYRTIGSRKEEVAEVMGVIENFLKLSTEPMKMSSILEHLKRVSNIVPRNGTAVMDSIMRVNSNIEKKGFGLYGYEEKTFKSVL